MGLEDIYTELVSEHSRNPEHRHPLPGATCSLKGHNPSCGDEITLQLNRGVDPTTALIDSSQSRLRPVMMASLTTILGMIPLLSDAMFGSMAAAIMGGLLFATLITLLFIPVLYALFFHIKQTK